MSAIVPRHYLHLVAVAYLTLLLPPVQHTLEATMTAQMLVQIPLLIAIGYFLGRAMAPHLPSWIAHWNHGGVTGLILTSIAGLAWMLPRLLDASVAEPWAMIAKFISVPLLIGVPFGISWPQAGFIVRGVFLLELIATFFRLGWLFMISPTRLCSNYLLSDQQRLGEYLLVIGAGLLLITVFKLVFGRFGGGLR
ncbi:hypothetical protein H0A71_17790 [Alcaligenaceae bacterium]|nr:hypothetical protein [Alcaligenaceae bacterium]